MQIGTNSIAQTAIYGIHAANAAAALASERISSGLRINHASDDPAGMALGNRLKTQISSMSKAIDNVNQGMAMTQIVDGSLSQIANVLADMYTLANYDSSNTYYSTLMTSYLNEIDSIAQNALWNGSSLMYDGSTSTNIQAGPSSDNTITLEFDQVDTSSSSILNLGASTMTSASSATTTAQTIDAAQTALSNYQAYIGGMSNVLTYQGDALSSASTAYSTAYGNTMNADMAQETANLAAAQIQRDAATAILGQANGMNKQIVSYLLQAVTS